MITFAEVGVAKVDERVRLNDDSTGGTSTASAACGNPPVVIISEPVEPEYRDADELRAMFLGRGFADADTHAAQQLFERVNYQHLLPYIEVIEKAGERNRTFKNVHDLLTFDRRFQASTFKYIGIFETQLRAAYANAMAVEHGAFALYDPDLFLKPYVYATSVSIHADEIERKARRKRGIKRAYEKYGNRLPIWIAVELMSLGTVSKFFSNTGDRSVTGKVLQSFGAEKKEFSSWLRTITEARNAFAHFDPYIVRKQIPSVPLSVDGVTLPNTSPLYIVILLHRLLDAPTFTDDPNARYAERLRQDTMSVLESFFSTHDDDLLVSGVPSDWRASLSFWDVVHLASSGK